MYSYQRFALNDSNEIVDITNSSLSCGKYICPYCHSEMIAKRGKIRHWHFAHKSEKCSYDKYLHSIAEIMIKDWFNREEHIFLAMDNYVKCKINDKCVFYDETECKVAKRVEFDLKNFYTKCILEHKYNGFVADLFCEHIKNIDLPIFVEIFVNHECSQEKIESGIRIIELSVETEEDILNIIKSNKFIEGEKVRLYNFKRHETCANIGGRQLQKYILYSSLKSFVARDFINCKSHTQNRKGIFELTLPYKECLPYFVTCGGLYKVGKVKAHLTGFLKQDCDLCFWQAEDWCGSKFCKLYKKCGNPKYCDENDASKCIMFRKNKQLIKEANDCFEDFKKNYPVDVWAINNLKT